MPPQGAGPPPQLLLIQVTVVGVLATRSAQSMSRTPEQTVHGLP
jgi:hypothetical protein